MSQSMPIMWRTKRGAGLNIRERSLDVKEPEEGVPL